jgi:hypothetical protein
MYLDLELQENYPQMHETFTNYNTYQSDVWFIILN